MKSLRVGVLSFALLCAMPAFAEEPAAPPMTPEQQAMMAAWEKAATPGPQHALLKAFVGNWSTTASMWMDPSAPPNVSTGNASNALIYDGRYLQMTYAGVWDGKPFQGQGLLGYQNVDSVWFSTWIDSGSTSFWLAKGSYDEAKQAWTLRGEMVDPMAPATPLPVRTITRWVDADHYVFEWYETRAGKELKTMQIDYARTK